MALEIAAAQGTDRVDLEFGLGALGSRRHAQAVGERDDGADDRDRFGCAFRCPDDEGAVDLDRRALCLPEIAERRIAGAEIVADYPDYEREGRGAQLACPAAAAASPGKGWRVK